MAQYMFVLFLCKHGIRILFMILKELSVQLWSLQH